MGAGSLFEIPAMYMQMTSNNQDAAHAITEDKQNQNLANSAAADAVARGSRNAQTTRMQGSQTISAQRVAYAASGVDPTVGTPVDVAGQTRFFSELDAKTQENNAAREAWGFKTYGVKYGQQAQLEETKASNKTTATILGGVGKLASYGAKDKSPIQTDDPNSWF